MKERASEFINNPESRFEMSVAVATNFRINGQDYLIPMITEESSVVAAASNGAKMLRDGNGIEAEMKDDLIMVRASVKIDEASQNIMEASVFAQLDPYRAATHNKGIMNGVDAVVFAVGGSISEAEAEAHSFAARDGQYRGLSTWMIEEGRLIGELKLPIFITEYNNNPAAEVCREILGKPTLLEINMIAASTGIAQNYAALRALATEGIQKGHMRLHRQHQKNLIKGEE